MQALILRLRRPAFAFMHLAWAFRVVVAPQSTAGSFLATHNNANTACSAVGHGLNRIKRFSLGLGGDAARPPSSRRPRTPLGREESPCPWGCSQEYRFDMRTLRRLVMASASKKTAKRDLRVPFSSDCAAPDLVVASRQPVAPSSDRACPLTPHAVVIGSCQRRAAPTGP